MRDASKSGLFCVARLLKYVSNFQRLRPPASAESICVPHPKKRISNSPYTPVQYWTYLRGGGLEARLPAMRLKKGSKPSQEKPSPKPNHNSPSKNLKNEQSMELDVRHFVQRNPRIPFARPQVPSSEPSPLLLHRWQRWVRRSLAVRWHQSHLRDGESKR